jgi:PAS domain S-box-containing protein
MPLRALNDFEGLGDAPRLAETILGLIPESGVMVLDVDLRIVLMDGDIYTRHGYGAGAAVGRDVRDVIPAVAWSNLGRHWQAALAGEARTLDSASVDGRRDYWLHFAPLRSREGVLVGAILVAQDITARVRARDQLEARLGQQSMVGALGSRALHGATVAELVDEAAGVVQAGLGADLVLVLEHTADGVLVRADAGGVTLDAPTRLDAALRRSLGVLRAAREPLLSHDLRAEPRFEAPRLEAAGMVSLVAAPIGSGADAFGGLLACSRKRAAFSEDDLGFVQSVGNILTAAIERERAVARAADAESRMAEFWQLSLDLLAIFTPDGRFLEVSGGWERTLGWSPDELIGRSALELVVADDRPATVADADPTAQGAGAVAEVVNRLQTKDGSSRWLLWSVRQGPDGSLYAVAKDITERYEERELAARREEQLNDAQRLAGMGSWESDSTTNVHTLSENLRDMLAVDSCLDTEDALLARVHPEDRESLRELILTRLEDGGRTEFRVVLPDGRVRILSAVVRPLRDADGRPTGLRGTVLDVTDTRHSEAALRRSEERFRQSFDNAPIAMTMVDPSSLRFERVNDAFCRMVERTPAVLRELSFTDIGHPDELAAARQQVQRLVSGELDQYVAEKRYLRPDGSELWVSVGVTPVREPDGTVDVLFGQMVDITERKAREASLHAQLEEISWLGEIRRAFAEDRFELHAQPIVDLASGEVVQRELLIRMRGRDGALIPPAAFLPAAETHGAIRDIDRWVIAQGADLAAAGVDVEINISAASIGDPGLVEDIEAEIARTGADPRRLVFEITETALLDRTELAVTLAERLRKLGCRFALDDFGSGYGGFHYLKHLPMDFLKIDREFVRDATSSQADQHVIHAIVGLAQGFGLRTIAEGVEDEATLQLLRDVGVDHVQGFHLGRPAPLEGPS